jgi:adenylate cyclase
MRTANAVDVPDLHSVALRPFKARGDSLASLYAEGMATGLLPGLHRVEGIAVKSPERFFGGADESIDDVTAGRRLGVDAVLSGEVRLVGRALRVTPRLTRVHDGAIIWTDNFDAEFTDVFEVHDSIAVDILAALAPRLASQQRTVVTRGVRSRDPEAYQHYLRARRLITRVTPQSVEQAIAHLDSALQRDSSFADAWVELSNAYSFYAQVGFRRPLELASAMRRAIQKAIALDDRNGEAYTYRGSLQGLVDWNWDEALSDFRLAVRLSPGSANAWLYYAQFLNGVAEHDSALAAMKRAISLDSLDAFLWANLAFRYHAVEMADSAIVAAERALSLDSTQWVASLGLSMFYDAVGRRADALSALEDVNRYAGDGPASLAWRAREYARLSRPDEARTIANRLTTLARSRYVPNIYIALAHLATGDTLAFLKSLEESFRDHDFDLSGEVAGISSALDGNPRFDVIRKAIYPAGVPKPRTSNR